MKVLVVSNMYPDKKNPIYGIFVRNFCMQLKSITIDYSLVAMHKNKNKIRRLFSYLFFYLDAFLKSLFGKFDIIYIHQPSYSALPVLAALKFKKLKIFVNVHGTDVLPYTKNQKIFEANTVRILKYTEKVIVPSEYFLNVVSDKYGFPESRIIIYPSGGVDQNIFKKFDDEKIAQIRAAYGVDNSKFIVGFVSRIYKEKGWETFIEAINILSKTNENMRFVICGSGKEDSLLEEKIREYLLSEYICRIPGKPQEELADIYNMLDVFVFPTQQAAESLGLVAIEAMACGVPVIASDYAAPGCYVKNGQNGFKFEMNNYQNLAKMITYFYELPDTEKAKMAANALETANKYSFNEAREILKTVFDLKCS